MARTVLIVEDEPEIAALLSDVLEDDGFRVTLTTGSRAAARVVELRPEVVIMDYLLPGINGAQVVEQIRAATGSEVPPIVLVTALAEVKELAAQVGVDAYMRKPFDVDRLSEIVRRLTGPRAG